MVTAPATTELSVFITATVAKGNGSLFDLSTTVPWSTVWAESATEMHTNRSVDTYFFMGLNYIIMVGSIYSLFGHPYRQNPLICQTTVI